MMVCPRLFNQTTFSLMDGVAPQIFVRYQVSCRWQNWPTHQTTNHHGFTQILKLGVCKLRDNI